MATRTKLTLFAVIACLTAAPANAGIIAFEASGQLQSVEYDFGGLASAAFLAGTPFGSPYRLSFSYDAVSTPTLGGPAGGWYQGIATASLTLAGTTFALNPTDVSTGRDAFAMSARFGLFGNFAMGQPSLNGFRPIDMHFELTDSTNTALTSVSLPSMLDLADFDNSYLRLRFIGAEGETGLRFTVTSLTGGPAQTVPEPAAWGLIVAGLGVMAISMRRRRGQAALAAA